MEPRKQFLSAIVVLAGLLAPVSSVLAFSFPSSEGYVSDFAGILSSETKTSLESQLDAFEKATSIEVAVATVNSLEGTTTEDYAVRLFEEWAIGKKGEDNGVLFLIAPNERKVKIEPGYGLEPVLNDAKAGRILDDYVTPYFADGDYESGVTQGTQALLAALGAGGTALVTVSSGSSSSDSRELTKGDLIWILPLILFIYTSSFLARSKSFWAGGAIGGVLGVIGGIIASSLLVGALATIGLGILGLLLDLIFSRTYKARRSLGLPVGFFRSGGGFFRSGGGGGFGGFGGGRSGGGGASRGW